MTENSYLLETIHLTRVYGDGDEIRALDDVNLRVRPGELLSVMGPSGSGKSTLLNLIGALDQPTGGQVLFSGQDLAQIKNVDEFRASTVGFVFQLHNLLPTLTARENVEIPMHGRLDAKSRKERAAELLALVDLEDRMDHLSNQLSGGQRQRVAVARALANNPALVLADEPTGNLDSSAGKSLMELIRKLNREKGTTLLIVTHDPAVARQTDRVIVMEDGRIAREDIIGLPIEEDLKMWRHSRLGQRILEGDGEVMSTLPISQAQFQALQALLRKIDGPEAR
ncbi:MAG: ABC transporter ATP-binding protein [Anaerolineales bacterium]|nr:MAG: ABC transporter ATP-binding protein [Anaerolineales bacterium]